MEQNSLPGRRRSTAKFWGKGLDTGRGNGLGASVSSSYSVLYDIERCIIWGPGLPSGKQLHMKEKAPCLLKEVSSMPGGMAQKMHQRLNFSPNFPLDRM